MGNERLQKQPGSYDNFLNRNTGTPFFSVQDPAYKPFFAPSGKQPHNFVPGRPAHNHPHLGNWPAVQAQSKNTCFSSPNTIDCACAVYSPAEVINTAYDWQFEKSPIAKQHLDHYLNGLGVDFNEDKNLYDLLVQDAAIRAKFGEAVHQTNIGYIPVWQGDYSVEDFRLSFGGIDRVDFEVHNLQDTVDIWFIDMYEFHPVGFGHTNLGTGDVLRETNCVHAAAVEMKAQGATDFWMKGQVTVPLNWLLGSRRGNDTGDGSWW